MITPAFSHARVTTEKMTDNINKCIDTFLEIVKSRLDPQTKMAVVDVYDRIQGVTLDVIVRTALNMQDANVQQPNDDLFVAVQQYFQYAQNEVVLLAIKIPLLRPLLEFVNNYMTAGRMTDVTVAHLKRQLKNEVTKEIDEKKQILLHALLKCYQEGKITANELIGNFSTLTPYGIIV